MQTAPLSALVTGLALLLYLVVSAAVSAARGRLKVPAPATTGNAVFERIYRVQQNTLEQLVFFLPSLWLFALFASDRVGAAIGLVWLIGRILYAVGYYRDAARRGAGFIIAMVAAVALLLGGLGGVLRALL
jgi:uncharacterized membrane protein YecN with MAPEG domain